MDLKSQFDLHLQKCPILAILRGIGIDEVRPVCDVLYDNGIMLLEIPMNTPNVLECIRIAAEHCKGRQLVGAGTVLEPSQVTAVKQAGGQFIVSPNTDESVIRHTKAEGMLSIPGFFTATEGFQALRYGADYLKLFPAILGPAYVKDLKAVIKAPIMAVGGVNSDNLSELLKVCCGAGIGSALYKQGKTIEEIDTAAKALLKAIGK
ncbi:MAG: 2-dehydro-3-deoxy-6-phosphogalactonate aldolase [Victivallales bacterium]|nr:2-dehydro-3-deoxy-6-phosphogalactonate aldolase [Victivallales bacterium]